MSACFLRFSLGFFPLARVFEYGFVWFLVLASSTHGTI